MGLEKMHPRQVQLAFYKGTHREHLCILGPHCTHLFGHPLATSLHLHGLDEIFLETFLFLWTLAQ